MSERTDRLDRLLVLQTKLKRLHETRHAGHVSAAVRARDEAADLARRFDTEPLVAQLFPDLYNRRIAEAVARGSASEAQAAVEARQVAEAMIRADRVEDALDAARLADQRRLEEIDALEIVERAAANRAKVESERGK